MIRINGCQIVPGLDTVRVIDEQGRFTAKSGGQLMVALNFPESEMREIFNYYQIEELNKMPDEGRHLPGCQMRIIADVPAGGVGGKHFHRIRTILVTVVVGKFEIFCEDLAGDSSIFRLEEGQTIMVRPFIYMTYKSILDGGIITVVGNTHVPYDERLLDKFDRTAFDVLKVDPGTIVTP